MLIDCTLQAFKVPGFSGVNPPFGTKKPDEQPVTAREANTNIMMPFALQRPHPVTENSVTSAIQANQVIEFTEGDITLTLANAAFNGCQLVIINTAPSSVTVIDGESEYTVEPEASLRLEYIGGWKVISTGGGGNGGVYSLYEELPMPGKEGQQYFVLADNLIYVWSNTRGRYETHVTHYEALPGTGIAGRWYTADDDELFYTWHDTMYGEHYPTVAGFPNPGATDRYYIADTTPAYKYEWATDYAEYMIRFQTMSAFPHTGLFNIVYVALDTDIRYHWNGASYEPLEGGSGTAGGGDNITISEENLLTVLGVSTIPDAIDELHARLNNSGSGTPYLGGLKLGMYLDLPSLNDGSTTMTENISYQNLRIRISGFNHYKNAQNAFNHIVFEFKHIPVTKQMRTDNTNDGGYPKSTGTVVLKPYLEGGFLTGLKAALGITSGKADYIRPVRRNVTQGSNGAWTKTAFDAAIFLPCEKEVFGTNTYGDATTEADLTQLPIYAQGQTKVKNYNGSADNWWEGSPRTSNTTNFCAVINVGYAYASGASSTHGCSPCFPLS
jgi:hypothetical protein